MHLPRTAMAGMSNDVPAAPPPMPSGTEPPRSTKIPKPPKPRKVEKRRKGRKS